MLLRARSLASSLVGVVVVAACSTSEQSPSGMHEDNTHLAKVAQDLTQAQLFGTSLPNKVLALTFDDGPGARAGELSTYLKNQGIRATFFINGARVNATALPNPNGVTVTPNAMAMLQQIVADGHLVANHTTTHRDVTTLGAAAVEADLTETDAIVSALTPANRLVFRAPYGNWNATAWNNLKVTPMNKYVGPVYWEAGGNQTGYPNMAADWACWQGDLRYANNTKVNVVPGMAGYATTQQCGDAYVTEIDSYGKGIVLMHDPYSWAQGSTVDMVQYMVPILKAKGYTFARIDEVPAIAAQLPCDASCATCTGPNDTQCVTCGGGRFLQAGACKTCSTCNPGTYASAPCAANADTVCSACDPACATCTGGGNAACNACNAGYWLNGTTCLPCTQCAPGTYASAACTATSDTVCAACDAACGTCTGPTANDCGSCPAGKWLSNGMCKACSKCAAGTYASAACTPTTDTVCTACAAGSWSAEGSATCTACGSCDDGNACTTDACDATKGCTHTAIAGCPSTPDAGTDAGSSSSGSSGTPGTDAGSSSGTPPAPGADGGSWPPSGPIDDGVGVTDEGGGGCSTSGAGGRDATASALLFAAALASVRRRRRAS